MNLCTYITEDGPCMNICEGRTEYCATHNRQIRKQETAKAKEKNPVKKVSAKRSVENQQYARLRKEYLEAYPVCEVVECHRKSTQIHHIKGRANDLLNDVNYFLAVCDLCHQRIHAEPKWAEENNYIEKRSV